MEVPSFTNVNNSCTSWVSLLQDPSVTFPPFLCCDPAEVPKPTLCQELPDGGRCLSSGVGAARGPQHHPVTI